MSIITWATNSQGAWDTGANWAGGTKPGASDTALFDGEFTGDVTAPAGTETVQHVEVASSYSGPMGTPGSPLTVDCTNMTLAGSGPGYWTTDCAQLLVNSRTRTGDGIRGIFTVDGGEEAVCILNGKFTLLNASSVQNMFVGSHADGPTVILQDASEVTNTLDIFNGRVTAQSGACGGIHIRGGVLNLQDVSELPQVFEISGGLVRVTGTSTLTMNEIRVLGGTFDISGHQGGFTLSAVCSLLVMPLAYANMNSGKSIGWDGNATAWVFPGGQIKQFRNDINPIVVGQP